MRSAASCTQPLHEIRVPRGAVIMRVVLIRRTHFSSWGAWYSSEDPARFGLRGAEDLSRRDHRRQPLDVGREHAVAPEVTHVAPYGAVGGRDGAGGPERPEEIERLGRG